MKQLTLLCCFFFVWVCLCKVCKERYTYRKSTRCYLIGRCRQKRQGTRDVCCDGWTGDTQTGCSKAKCDKKTNPNACSVKEGYVKTSASGEVYTSSGGTCDSPDNCINCNPGYYSTGSNCRVCPQISNCYYEKCSTRWNSVCHYCEGVVKDDKNKYGWWAYTLWTDGGQSCKQEDCVICNSCNQIFKMETLTCGYSEVSMNSYRHCAMERKLHLCVTKKEACSWREGSRCYPGSCSDTTLASCECSPGFKGKDCATITTQPTILGSFVQLKHVTNTSVELVDAPLDMTASSPQEVVYTNKHHLDMAEAYVDASFVYTLPRPDRDDFYVKYDSCRVGIVNGGVSLTLIRASSSIASVSTNCAMDPPLPTNYRCNTTFSLRDRWTSYLPFGHKDIIQFETYSTNGGYVTIYDRENNKQVKYMFQGTTQKYRFEIGIDTESPEHCKLFGNCDVPPLNVTDVSIHPTMRVNWQGWYDDPAGIDSYHFELFHLRSTGPEETDKLAHGDKVIGAIAENVLSSVDETTVELQSPGPYSLTIAAFDRAGNHKTARRVLIFDDKSKVERQGDRTVKVGPGGSCIWENEPAAPIISNANPNANCDWIVTVGQIQVVWKDYFINTRHYADQWLNGISSLDHVDSLLDDHEGKRHIERVDNILGVVDFKISYETILDGQSTKLPSFHVTDLYAQSATIDEVLEGGMGINITVSAFDITGAYANESVFVKVDFSPPVINDLWLTVGNMTNVSVHNVEDLSKLTIEWKTYDYEAGIHSIMWRIYDNYTGVDFDHGSAYESPQGNTETLEECQNEYGSYPRGAKCYCTPFDGCFHQHFQVKPKIDVNGTNGLPSDRHVGNHDHDYFAEVTVTSKAMLKSTLSYKITIDTSPPSPGTVLEGFSRGTEVDFQKDAEFHVHWKDFFDPESGVLFYDYTYGTSCYDSSIFTVDRNGYDGTKRTFGESADLTASSDGTYFVTVVAFNRALDHSKPVCSDGITIESRKHTVSRVSVGGAKTDEGPIKTDDDIVWLLHVDRTIQQVKTPSDSCRMKAPYVSMSQMLLYKLKEDSQGRIASLQFLDCDAYRQRNEIVSYISVLDRLEITWTTNDTVSLFNTEIGLASHNSDQPDIATFKSAFRHKYIHLENLNLVDGEMFDVLIKSTTKSGISNYQNIGIFVTDTSPPSFRGDIDLSTDLEGKTLIARWTKEAFVDYHQAEGLNYDFAVGSQHFATDVQHFQGLQFNKDCPIADRPTCTSIHIEALERALHHLQKVYVTIRATNKVGLSVTAVSPQYTHNVRIPAKGVVFDLEAGNLLQDADYQLSRTELRGKWFGFETPQLEVNYTICLAQNDIPVQSTCMYVHHNRTGIIAELNLNYFTVYQLAVLACSPGGCTTVMSDGIMPLDTSLDLNEIVLYDGHNCEGHKDLTLDTPSHHDQVFTLPCSTDIDYQYSMTVLNVDWKIPETYTPFIKDVLWLVQQRAPVAEHWENVTEINSDIASLSGARYTTVLESGRAYRFWLRFCAEKFCFPNLKTDGVTVLHYPPKAGAIDVMHEQMADGTKLKITFDGFKDPDIESPREARGVMDHYEWAIQDRNGGILDKWKTATDAIQLDDRQVYFEVQLTGSLHFNKCWHLNVRGHNKVGLHSTISTDINDCHKDPTVIDVVGPSVTSDDGDLLGGDIHISDTYWEENDRDYTSYDNILSAVWPTLRYLRYTYAIVRETVTKSILFHEENISTDINTLCDDPNTILCGHTDNNYVNVHIELAHGKRYSVCVHANATLRQYETWKENLPEITVCSDGITVDTTPPTPGNVYIIGPGVIYQQSLTEILLQWDSFIDVEELKNAAHSTGVKNYELALGTDIGERDVKDWINVNLTNHYIVHGLNLQKGHRYYATVKGYDFTGKYAIAHSSPVTTDTTPPVVSNTSIAVRQRYITNEKSINIYWPSLMDDPESGIAYYEYSVGTRPGYDDINFFTKTLAACADVDVDALTDIEEGHDYYISVRGYNGAGLSVTASSWSFVVDYSPPDIGNVMDGQASDGKDNDYQIEKHSLAAFWSGFHDAHTNIVDYFVEVGTEQDASNIVRKHSVGTKQEIVFGDLHLVEGQKYYVTVTACNAADICSFAVSDGIVVDSTAPVPGIVVDGSEVDDVDYQSSSNAMASRWFGFVDAQSGISHYSWRLGTAPGADDIIAPQNVYLVDTIVFPDITTMTGQLLPVGKRLYATVRAFNGEGQYSESTSNGVIVDVTAPEFATPLRYVPIGSLHDSKSVLGNMLKVQWEVNDDESFIARQYLSIVPHVGEDFNISVQIPGLDRDYTFTDINLNDGSYYDVIIWSCNYAKRCSKSTIPGLLVDSTHPTSGTFAIHTDHAANLHGHLEQMTWSQNTITVSLVGFSDEHSGISNYYINVGSSYMDSDLNSGDVDLIHNDDSSLFSDGGKVQFFTLITKDLENYQHVFITVLAQNGVGLVSKVTHSQFKLIPGGDMELVRRCETYSCQGHCVCAASDQKCPTDSNTPNCVDVTADSSYATVEVTDSLMPFVKHLDINYTPTNVMLAACWSVSGIGKQPKWYEWSVGLTEESGPQGIFTTTDRIWHDASQMKNVTFIMDADKHLHDKERYSVFVRAWYSGTQYATFKSSGVDVLSKKPQTANLFGKSVNESLHNNGIDVDFCNGTELLLIDWTGVFKDDPETMFNYEVYIGNTPGGHSSLRLSDIPASSTQIDINLLDYGLLPGKHYYSMILAYTLSGLHTTAVSDGFVIDMDTPMNGVVFDGKGMVDLMYQNQSEWISAHWYGYVDAHTTIQSYTWCVSSSGNEGSCDVIAPTNVGMKTNIETQLPSGIENGQKIVNEVSATDVVGHTSANVVSNGVVIDLTSPVALHIGEIGDNIIQNPSFEHNLAATNINNLKPQDSCNAEPIASWGSEGCALVVKGSVEDGNNALWLRGNISQTLSSLSKGWTYSLQFYVSHTPNTTRGASTENTLVRFGEVQHVFQIHSRLGNTQSFSMISWQKISGTFVAQQDSIVFTIGTMPRSEGVLIDNIKLTEMDEVVEANYNYVTAHAVLFNGWASIHASWKCEDKESGIKQYLFAVGTVRGGTQLQPFRSVGKRQFETLTHIDLSDGMVVHVTVIATNGADLDTLLYSGPLLIDQTPPFISEVNDGPTKGHDIDFQEDKELYFSFNVHDPESGIKGCFWALGTSTDYDSVNQLTKLPEGVNTGHTLLDDPVDISRPLFVTVRCVNNAGLTSEQRSDGLQIVQSQPDASGVVLDILGGSESQYPVRDLFHGRTGDLSLRWSGFRFTDAIQYFEVLLVGDDTTTSFEVLNSGSAYTFLNLDDIQMEPGQYSCLLTGVNRLGVSSGTIARNVTIVTDSPRVIDHSGISMKWDASTERLTLDWAGVFHFIYDLYYEISVGTADSSADIIQWQETVSTHIKFPLATDYLGEFGANIFVVVTAISPAGTYTTVSMSQLITKTP